MEELDLNPRASTGKIHEHILIAYETALKALRANAQLAMEEKLGLALPMTALDRQGFEIVYADIGSGRKMELRYDASHEKSNRESAFTISISKDPYDPEAKEINFFLPSSPQYAGHEHPYSREKRTNEWRPSEAVLSIMERAINDFRSGERI